MRITVNYVCTEIINVNWKKLKKFVKINKQSEEKIQY